jgi:hypothetical protein
MQCICRTEAREARVWILEGAGQRSDQPNKLKPNIHSLMGDDSAAAVLSLG